MGIELETIGHVRCVRVAPGPDRWGGSQALVELNDAVEPSALDGIEAFSHAEILFHCHAVAPTRVVRGANRPQGQPDGPRVGILAQRDVHRPNRLASSIVRILGREGRRLWVAELDAFDGSPVVDIKPVLLELLPREDVTQPEWAHALMRGYWRGG